MENPHVSSSSAPVEQQSTRRCPARNCVPEADRILIIPDVHQDIDWAAAILECEEGTWDHVIFLGDYFDSAKQPPYVATADKTAKFFQQVQERYQDRVTFLWGNHDIPYLEMLQYDSEQDWPVVPLHTCSGYNRIRALEIARAWSGNVGLKGQLFVEANGYLLSHAGVHPSLWPDGENPFWALDSICETALQELRHRRSEILAAGTARGGWAEVGGITWMDWNDEFEENERLPPQIVGHTLCNRGPRTNGRSWCIDGNQTCWAVLDRAGNLEIRYLPGRS